ncbi:MAG: DUF4173 domain-containing protein [Vicinamibacterales bacterium]|nr:DUF4173 domain-containing protein [Vicinamibacterales bacterium]
MRDRASHVALTVLGLAVVLGVAGNLLLRVEPWGLNALVAALAFALGFHLLVRRLHLPVRGAGLWLWATVPVLAAVLAWRASPPLIVAAVLGVLIALVATAVVAHARDPRDSDTWDLIAEALATGLHAAFGIARLAIMMQAGAMRWAPWHTRTGAIVRGIVLAVPPLVVFGALFVSADAAFAHLLDNLITIELDQVASHVILTGVFAWLAAGWLYWVVASDGGDLPRSHTLSLGLGALEVGVALGLVMALFVVFIAVQSAYLFGGEALVQATTGLTYAEYARRGFFELVAAAFLVLPLLLVGLWLVRHQPARDQRAVRMMAAGLEVLILVILASALYRMHLYQEAYGLTQLRFLTTAFIIWLAVIFVLFSATVLRGAPRYFTAGAVTTALAAAVLLAIVNPDARIVEANLQRAHLGAAFDAGYVRTLSADAVPALVAALPTLPEPGRCATAHWLVTRWGSEARARRPGDWRTWNYSRANAQRLVQEHEPLLRTLACPPEPDL